MGKKTLLRKNAAKTLDCIDIIRQGIGRELSEDEILGLFKQAKILRRRARAGRNAADMERRAREASLEWARQEELAAIARKRAIELQTEKLLNNVAYVLNTFRGMEGEGISALQVGSKYAREGARLSVDAIRCGLEGQYLGGFLADLESLGKAHVALFRKGELDRDVARAMWTIDNPAAAPYTGPREAMDIARVAHKWQEKTRLDQNRAGAWIGRQPGYIVRQSHDAAKLRKLGSDAWKDAIRDRLDWTRTADGMFDPEVTPAGAEKFLDAVYDDIVTGVHLRTGGMFRSSKATSSARQPRGRRVSVCCTSSPATPGSTTTRASASATCGTPCCAA